jgi:hypothetical protein
VLRQRRDPFMRRADTRAPVQALRSLDGLLIALQVQWIVFDGEDRNRAAMMPVETGPADCFGPRRRADTAITVWRRFPL